MCLAKKAHGVAIGIYTIEKTAELLAQRRRAAERGLFELRDRAPDHPKEFGEKRIGFMNSSAPLRLCASKSLQW
jgi:hypothetical protein